MVEIIHLNYLPNIKHAVSLCILMVASVLIYQRKKQQHKMIINLRGFYYTK